MPFKNKMVQGEVETLKLMSLQYFYHSMTEKENAANLKIEIEFFFSKTYNVLFDNKLVEGEIGTLKLMSLQYFYYSRNGRENAANLHIHTPSLLHKL